MRMCLNDIRSFQGGIVNAEYDEPAGYPRDFQKPRSRTVTNNGNTECRSVGMRKIVRVQYFVRGGFVGHHSRASSKHLSPSSSGRRARLLGGQKGVALHLQAARVGVGSTKKPTRC
ncbi:hypothetical protein TNCV_3839871 [Trichonephila clavipes]|nr:hypothetical protein TNCV_3839871 [Trichonephila clavipes]